MKKTLSLLLSIVMLLSITAGIDLSVYAATSGDFEYTVFDNGTAEITKYTGSATDLTIPSALDEYTVTSIGNQAFSSCTSLTSITIPDSVMSIGDQAFYNCTSLTSVTIPSSAKIENYVFTNCSKIETIKITMGIADKQLDVLDNSIWSSSKSTLKEVIIENGVKSAIGDSAFSWCKSLTSITISDSVTSIGDQAFYYCTSLPSITIPDSVTSIGNYSFYNCKSLANITMSDSIISIGENAFLCCTSLETVTIPDSVTSIGEYAFFYCRSLKNINVDNNKYYSSIDGNLYNKAQTELIQYSAGKEADYFEVPDSVTTIGEGAFSGSANLINITIPDSVTSIGRRAFYICSGLTALTIPENVSNISDYAFYYCKNLKNIEIPNSVISIGESAFENCSALESITIPDSVITLGKRAFYGCEDLESIVIPKSITNISDYLFYGCKSLKSAEIPESVESIGNYAFSACTSLAYIIIPESVTNIGEYALYGCSSLKGIKILNPDCIIEENPKEDIISDKAVIYGYANSTAQAYVEKYRRTKGFVAIDDYNCESDGHRYVLINTIDAACTEEGAELYICMVCEDRKTEAIEATGHKWDEGKVTKAATCSETGIKTYTCTVCKETKTEIIEKTKHTVVKDFDVSANCTKPGKTEGSHCSVCGEVITAQEVIPATGHKWSKNGIVTKAASCTKAGVKTYICTKCGATKTEAIEATGHSWDSGKVTKAATCASPGIKTYTCTKCGATKSVATAKTTVHKYVTITAKATTKKNGSIVTKCSVCGAKKSSTTIPYIKSITLSSTSYTYNGKVRKPSVTVKDSKGNKISSKYYTVTYSKGRKSIGIYTVTVKFKGNYSGTVKKTFTIKPKGTSISKLTAKSKGFTVKWKKQTTQTTGYQIQYSTSSKFTSKTTKTVTVSKNKTTSKTISKLKAKKKYYVRIRTYKIVGGKKIYSAWSKAKSVTAKK